MSEPLKKPGDENEMPVTVKDNPRNAMAASVKIAEDSEHYRLIVETAQEGIWMLDENNVIVFVNKKMCEILEYPQDELVGKQNYDFKDEEGKRAAVEHIQRRKQGINDQHESTFITKSGKRVWVSVSTNGIFDAKGAYKGSLAMITDITQRKLDEDALRRSKANLSAIIENTTDLVYSLDTNLCFITFNKIFKTAIKQVYGFDVEQGVSVSQMIDGFDQVTADKWHGIYSRALSGETLQFVNEYKFNDTDIWLSYSVNPIRENDKVIGLSCFSRDITRQKIDEIALKKSEASLRTIFDNTDMAYMLMDADLAILSFNALAQTFSTEQNGVALVEGAAAFDYFDQARQAYIGGLVQRVKSGETVSYQISRQFTGPLKWYDITWAGIKNQHGENIGYLLTNRDITQQKKLEMEREKITADLIQRNKDLEQFTYIISHNLRAPVANIMGLTSLLGSIEPDDAGHSGLVEGLEVSANRLDAVISDLNQILQVNSRVNEKVEMVQLPRLIDDIRVSISQLMAEEKVSITTDFTAVASMRTLKSYLHSVFYNLILNSIKYHRPGVAPSISIDTRADNEKITITYQDNGRGIDIKKNSKDLFGLYKRFDTSVEGKGMGLFMVKMQVESLGGTISIHSELNKGTRFEIEFPVAQVS